MLFIHKPYLLTKGFESGFQFMPQLSFGLFCSQIITVVHVLVLAKIGSNFAYFSVKLDIVMLFLSKHDGILQFQMILKVDVDLVYLCGKM